MTIKDAYNYGVYFLGANGVDDAEFKAKTIVCSMFDLKNSEYLLHQDDEGVMMKKYADLLWRVKSGEPLQYIVGKWDFYESEFFVGDGVLIPRPETEELVEKVIAYANTKEKPVIIDLCAGSGCIGISVAKAVKNSTVYCIEKSEKAAFYLMRNAKGIDNVKVIIGDISDFNNKIELADIIVSNPPYIKTGDLKTLQTEVQREPVMALDGGKDGTDFYKIINDKWAKNIKPDGALFLEIGDDQEKSVPNVLNYFSNIEVLNDFSGNVRMIFANNLDEN